MELSSLMGGGGAGGGGAPGKSASSSASSTSGNNFAGLVSDGGALTPLAGVVLAALSLFAFLGLVLIARK